MTTDPPEPAAPTAAAPIEDQPEAIVAAPDAPAEFAWVLPATAYEAIATDAVEVGAALVAADPLHAAIVELGATLARKVDALGAAFDREVRAEATREKVVDRLHAELQEAKNDLHLKLLRPVFVDLIQLHDDIGKIVEPATAAEGDLARLLVLMRGFQQGIEDILYRQGVEPFQVEGDAFDPRRQRAMATVTTDDPGRNKTVAARLRKGFRTGDLVIRPEVVSVHALRR